MSVRGCEIFHADVHAGNLLVLQDGRVGFIDFGIVGRIPPEIWSAVEGLVVAFARNDATGMARNLIAMGATEATVDEVSLAQDVASVLGRIAGLEPEVVLRGKGDGRVVAEVALDNDQVTELLLEVVRVADSNGLKLPREFALLVKQALYFDRYTKLLAPDLDPLRDERASLCDLIAGALLLAVLLGLIFSFGSELISGALLAPIGVGCAAVIFLGGLFVSRRPTSTRSESFSDLQPTPKAEEVRGSKMEEMPSNCIVGDWQEVAGHL
eukprot:g2346.t1